MANRGGIRLSDAPHTRTGPSRAGGPGRAALDEVSDAWLVGRARELLARAHMAVVYRDPEHDEEPGATGPDGYVALREMDDLLAEARRRGEPRGLGRMLRNAASLRLTTPDTASTIDPLLDELLTHARRHGLDVLEASAHALRGRRTLLHGSEDAAISETAWALAILDDDLAYDTVLGRRTWERLLSSVLVDIGLVLTQLGIYEMAEKVMARSHQCVRASGGPHEIAEHMISRSRMLTMWGLRLERIGEYDQARERFATASAMARSVEGPWPESLFPRRGDLPAADQVPALGTAHALAEPGVDHLRRLRSLLDTATFPRERIVLAIALSRCLRRSGDTEQARAVLADTGRWLEGDNSEPTLRMSLVREFAVLAEDEADGGHAMEEYAVELESELWGMRESRRSTLLIRLEHTRLTRDHSHITQQALQDPLTGLPNRRALNERLDVLVAQPEAQPLSVALVDLDGFKEVNDRSSHAEGDNVLRVVASTLRDTLRGDDVVARYGGDEFVVLLPAASLAAAEAALARAVDAVAALPPTLSRGVTLSVGVAGMCPRESGNQVLDRADNAMYQAKHQGKNRVAALPAGTP